MAGGGQQGASAPAQGQMGQGYAQGGQIGDLVNPQAPNTGYNMPYAGSNYAAPNQNFMAYPQQGQMNQPMLGAPTPTVQNDGGPDVTGNAGGTNMGFDGSGSDSGVGGHPVTSTQTPLQLGNKPLGLGQFQQPQGLQIQGNPTSSLVQRPQQR